MAGSPKPRSAETAFVSEVFHSLSQPLTALHCSLDLALRRDRTLKQLRASVRAALDNAERLRQRLLLARALNDAIDPGDLSHGTDLSKLLGQLCEDMLPLFESAGQRLQLSGDGGSLLVRADETRLKQALFCFVEYLFRYSPAGALLNISFAVVNEQQAEILIDTAACLPLSPEDDGSASPYSCEIELVRRTFRAPGGEFDLLGCESGRSIWRATLPLA